MERIITPKQRNRASVISMIAGIATCISLVLIFILWDMWWDRWIIYFSIVIDIIALITGIISLIQIKKSRETGIILAIIGIILGAIPLPLLLLLLYIDAPFYL